MSENRTEQATPRRQEKARERGQIARSRELSGALVILTTGALLSWQAPAWPGEWRAMFSAALAGAGTESFSPVSQLISTMVQTARWAGPVLLGCWGIAIASLLAQGGFVFAPAALQPDWNRLNPGTNAGQMFSPAGVSLLLKSLVPAGVLIYLYSVTLIREWPALIQASNHPQAVTWPWVAALCLEITWKTGMVLLAWAGFDFFAQRMQLSRQLRMSKQEVREESKETEGHPLIRMRIRRIQRQMRRRSMMKDVARATVVLTNPTEYAVALRYVPGEMDAPRLLAKGRGAFAQQIRSLAVWNAVPIIENPPLTRVLYRTVEVGQSIPAKLYAAVAEILAFIYRAQAAVQSATRARQEGNRA